MSRTATSSILALAALVSGCAERDDRDLVEAFEQVHTRVYGVYSLPLDRDAVHDLLAGSFAGEALTREYVEHWSTRSRMAEQGTAVAVSEVTYDRVEVVDGGDPVRLDVSWTVRGTVTHQGHSHQRTNTYEAIYAVARTDLGPRIVGSWLRGLQRVFDVAPNGSGRQTPLELLGSGR